MCGMQYLTYSPQINYPSNVIIDDKTRHATANVTRVYWEHFKKPVFRGAFFAARDKKLKKRFITMSNHHQGMFIATRYLLKQWKKRPNCKFDVVRDRPSLKLSPKVRSKLEKTLVRASATNVLLIGFMFRYQPKEHNEFG